MRDYYMRADVDNSPEAQAVLARLKQGDQLKIIREQATPEKKYSVRLETMAGEKVGHVAGIYSQRIAITMTHGYNYKVLVDTVTKGRGPAKAYELNLRVLYTVPDLSKIKRKKKTK